MDMASLLRNGYKAHTRALIPFSPTITSIWFTFHFSLSKELFAAFLRPAKKKHANDKSTCQIVFNEGKKK